MVKEGDIAMKTIEPWYQQSLVIVILTILFFPLGFALICVNPKYKMHTKVLWIILVVSFLSLVFMGWFSFALILSSILWLLMYWKHPTSESNMSSGHVCAYCGVQLPDNSVCPYCGGRAIDEK